MALPQSHCTCMHSFTHLVNSVKSLLYFNCSARFVLYLLGYGNDQSGNGCFSLNFFLVFKELFWGAGVGAQSERLRPPTSSARFSLKNYLYTILFQAYSCFQNKEHFFAPPYISGLILFPLYKYYFLSSSPTDFYLGSLINELVFLYLYHTMIL